MSLGKTLTTAQRVLSQLHHDKRTIGLILVVPCLLLWLMKYLFEDAPQVFNNIALMMLGIFPLNLMFLVTSIATLRERTSGTLDRLMTQPIAKADIVFGYALAFAIVGLVQASLASFVVLQLLDVTVAGSAWAVVAVAVVSAFLGTALGLCVSAFAASEFQAVQLVMPVIMPQVLLCGLFVARDQMADILKTISDFLPLTYSVDAMKQVTLYADWTDDLTKDLVIVFSCGIVALILGAITIRRHE